MSFPGELPLTLLEAHEMENSWLIQRLEPPINCVNPFVFGGGYKDGGLSPEAMKALKNIFTFEYMGAAEFEHGSISQTLNFLSREGDKKNLVSGILCPSEGMIMYICPIPYENEVRRRILVWAKEACSKAPQTSSKERVQLYEALQKKEYPRTRGWLELNNGFMFFIDEVMYAKTKEILGCT